MPPAIDLEPYRASITSYILNERLTVARTVRQLQEEGLNVSIRTLNRALAAWQISSPRRRLRHQDLELRARLTTLFYQWELTDQDMARVLTYDGFQITPRMLKKLRKEMGLLKTVRPWQEEELDTRIREVLQQEYDAGTIEDYGAGHLYTYIRNKYQQYHIVGRYSSLLRVTRTTLLAGHSLIAR